MDASGGPQVLKMPGLGKSKELTLHITNRDHQTHAQMSSPDNSTLHNRLPTLGRNTQVVTLTTSPAKPQQRTENIGNIGLTTNEYKDMKFGLPKINDVCRTNDDMKKRRLPTRAKSFMHTPRTLAPDDQPKVFNSEPVPFHTQLFRSSNLVRNVAVPSRHGDMWASPDSPVDIKRFMIHTDTNQLDDSDDVHELSHRERITSELAERLHKINVRRRREMNPHRASVDFFMGGQRVELSERDNVDVYQELKRLKSMVLPTMARDLYIGRGFKLPKKHALNNPRGSTVFDSKHNKIR